MKLLELKLKNIGPYKNETINFETNRNENIILLCGENGAGKTTILKSIKLGLFGSYLYGLKQNSKSNIYIDEVKSVIRNKNSKASIELKFNIIENYKENTYIFKRHWETKDSFKEIINIYLNGKELTGENAIDIISYVNNYFTPNVIDSIMFDGEKILGLVDNKMLSDYIKDSIMHLFNLNNYVNLINDIDHYLNNEIKNEALSIEQMLLNEEENKYKTIKKDITYLKKKIENLSKLIGQKTFNLNLKLQEYSKLGGLTINELKKTQKEVSELEKTRVEYNNNLKNYMENDLLLILNQKIIKETYNQLKKEEPLIFAKNIKIMIDSDYFDQEDKKHLLYLYEKMNSYNDSKIIMNTDQKSTEQFKKYFEQIEVSKEHYQTLLQSKQINLSLLKDKKKKIMITNGPEMKKLYNEILDEMNDLEYLNEQYNEAINSLNQNYNYFNECKTKIEDYKHIVFEQTKSNDSYVVAKKYQDVCINFLDSEIKRIVDEVSKNSTELIKKTYRKKNYITKIKINHDFSVNLFNNLEEKNMSNLSAGEKQLLVAIIIVTIIKLSERNMLLVFDTPAGRLDNKHMVKFYENIMMNSGNQVIIMPTSKEINDDVIKVIKNRVNTCYTINYNEKGFSQIEEGMIFERKWDCYDTKN